MAAKKPQEKPRRRPSQERSRESVDVIIEASAQVLQDYGYRGATTNRIAERAGVSVGTLYQYFKNKDEIFDALIQQEGVRYLSALEDNIPGVEVPLRQAIRNLLEAGYSHHRLVMGLRVVMRNLPSVAYAQRSRYLRRELHRLVVKFLENRGPIDGLDDLSLAADVIIAQCEGLTYLGRVDRSAEELIDVLTEALTRYLLAGTTESNEPSGRTGA
jgi:AcrR family transcriptional regulator